MQNYMMIDEKHLQTSYGIFSGVERVSLYATGEVESITLSEKNMVVTQVGELIPAYTENEHRKDKPSVEFGKDAMVRAVALEEQQEVITPIGEMPAEAVRFYSTGELHRIFVVDGKITGFWTVEDERKRNIPFEFDLDFTSFKAMLNGLCFYKSGEIKSITLFEKERVKVNTPMGEVETGVGMSLYESGALQSVEPAEIVIVTTPIGDIAAFDINQIGINADSNSLEFTEEGKIKSLITCDNSIYVQTQDGIMEKYSPTVKPHPLSDEMMTVEGMKIEFDYDKNEVIIKNRPFDMDNCGFTIKAFIKPNQHCSLEDCASCSICKS